MSSNIHNGFKFGKMSSLVYENVEKKKDIKNLIIRAL